MTEAVENDLVKRLMWSGLLAGLGAVFSIASSRAAALMWRRIFDEEPPE
ncbi:MAG: hypothetical protein ABSF58_11145 [Solirubrobacteraceae bacterium]